MSNFMEIRPVGAECSVRAGGRTDGLEEANSCFLPPQKHIAIVAVNRPALKTALYREITVCGNCLHSLPFDFPNLQHRAVH